MAFKHTRCALLWVGRVQSVNSEDSVSNWWKRVQGCGVEYMTILGLVSEGLPGIQHMSVIYLNIHSEEQSSEPTGLLATFSQPGGCLLSVFLPEGLAFPNTDYMLEFHSNFLPCSLSLSLSSFSPPFSPSLSLYLSHTLPPSPPPSPSLITLYTAFFLFLHVTQLHINILFLSYHFLFI